MNKTDDEEIPVYASSGNIFAHLGRPDAEEAFARVRQLVQLEELKREIKKGMDSQNRTIPSYNRQACTKNPWSVVCVWYTKATWFSVYLFGRYGLQ